jgi:hypothetical protein
MLPDVARLFKTVGFPVAFGIVPALIPTPNIDEAYDESAEKGGPGQVHAPSIMLSRCHLEPFCTSVSLNKKDVIACVSIIACPLFNWISMAMTLAVITFP